MSILKILAIAGALAVGASSMAMAQMSGANGNPARNAQLSGGSGTHKGAPKTGSAMSNQKVIKNQNGYRPQ